MVLYLFEEQLIDEVSDLVGSTPTRRPAVMQPSFVSRDSSLSPKQLEAVARARQPPDRSLSSVSVRYEFNYVLLIAF